MAAFGGQRSEAERFRERLSDARKAGVLRGFMTAVGCAAFWFVFYASYGLGFWYGVKLIIDEREACGEGCDGGARYDPSSLIKVNHVVHNFQMMRIIWGCSSILGFWFLSPPATLMVIVQKSYPPASSHICEDLKAHLL